MQRTVCDLSRRTQSSLYIEEIDLRTYSQISLSAPENVVLVSEGKCVCLQLPGCDQPNIVGLTLEVNCPVDHELLCAIEGSESKKEMIFASEFPVHHAGKSSVAVEMCVSLQIKGAPAGCPLKAARRPGIEPESLDSNSVGVKVLFLPRLLSLQVRHGANHTK